MNAVSEKAVLEQANLRRGNGELVLVVDDEEMVREVTKEILERFNYHVVLAANGAEAIALYTRQQREIAVILTDMVMPVMDGAALVVAVKTINPQALVIGTSGYGSADDMVKATGGTVKHFVPKPHTAETILNALYTVLHEP
ncbi:MAG TPA: response regulator [Verrucomicrobiae bacterium]|jgi:DNA-binding NtrC family response regulator